jgi:hypothetical protein
VPSDSDKQRTLGPALIAGGSAVVFLSMFIDWISVSGFNGSFSGNLWKSDPGGGHRVPILLLLIIILALALAASFYFQRQTRVLPLLGAVGLLEAGFVIALAAEFAPASNNGGAGGWIGGVAAIAIAVGAWQTLGLQASALAGLAGAVRGAAAGARSAAPGAQTAAPGGQTQAPKPTGETADIQQGAARGWYPDPSGQHRERFWDGTAWTEHVR